MSAIGRPRRRGEAGFTLMEALVVVGVAALVAGIAFPSVEAALRRTAFAAAGNSVALALRAARADAMRHGGRVVLMPAMGGRALLREGAGSLVLPDGIALALSPRGIAFFADGTASGGTLVLTGGGRQRRMTVDPITGEAGW